jgi:hypothetical protein
LSTELNDIIKRRYGEAARRVANGGSNGCCGGSALLQGSCDPITSNLYDHNETNQIPGQALRVRSAAAIQPRSQNLILARRCWTSVPAAVSTCYQAITGTLVSNLDSMGPSGDHDTTTNFLTTGGHTRIRGFY